MFEPSEKPRLFAMAPGVDFPRALVDGVLARMTGKPPEDLARVRIIVNTRRMQRRLHALFGESGPRLLPRISLLTETDQLSPSLALPPAVSALARRLDLIQLVTTDST